MSWKAPLAAGQRRARTRPPAIGAGVRRPGLVGLMIRLDEPIFAALRVMAERDNVSMAEQVRTVIEWGLESAGVDA